VLALGIATPPIIMHNGSASPEVKWKEPEVEHSPPSNTEVKSGGAVLPLFPAFLWCGA
jgi:hypothetical protein